MATTISPNMSLPVPIVGQEAGPQYAIDVDACLAIIDQHNHTSGQGVQIPPGGLNINANLPFNNNSAIEMQTVRFQAQSPAIPATGVNLGCLFEGPVGGGSNGDLFYNDAAGNQIQITSGGHVNSGAGSISGLVSPASASYNSVSKTFVWQSDVSTPANLDAASIILRNLVASSPGLTLSPPTLGGDYTITLPPLPGSNLPVSIDNTGLMSATPITYAQLATAVQTTINTVPTVQTFTSGSGTYAPTSASVNYIRVRMVGGGGGGGGSGTSGAGTGSAGGDTTFGPATAFGASGGAENSPQGGAGGSSAASGVTIIAQITGATGGCNTQTINNNATGGAGGNTPFGGGAPSSGSTNVGGTSVGTANTGGGGGGAQVYINAAFAGTGGGGGGYIEFYLSSPTPVAYSVGGGGAGGSAGAGGGVGGAGGSGIIIVEEHYGS